MGFFYRKPDFHIPEDRIDRIETITIGGIQQTIHEKNFIWMEKLAHLFHPDDTARIEQQLINELSHIKAEVINL